MDIPEAKRARGQTCVVIENGAWIVKALPLTTGSTDAPSSSGSSMDLPLIAVSTPSLSSASSECSGVTLSHALLRLSHKCCRSRSQNKKLVWLDQDEIAVWRRYSNDGVLIFTPLPNDISCFYIRFMRVKEEGSLRWTLYDSLSHGETVVNNETVSRQGRRLVHGDLVGFCREKFNPPDLEYVFWHPEPASVELRAPSEPSLSEIPENLESQITLNVGGVRFVTSASTLCRSEYFQSVLSRRWKAKFGSDGEIFIEGDGNLFHHILRYLRAGEDEDGGIIGISELSPFAKMDLMVEADRFMLEGLKNRVRENLNVVLTLPCARFAEVGGRLHEYFAESDEWLIEIRSRPQRRLHRRGSCQCGLCNLSEHHMISARYLPHTKSWVNFRLQEGTSLD